MKINNPKTTTPPSSLSTPSSSRVKDALLYIVCIAGIVISLNLFRLDLYKAMTRLSDQPVGIITFKYKAAQRRFVDRVLWDRLRRESPVYNGDLIRTADLSEATITFADGAVLDLAENSLIQLHAEAGGARIDIGGGEVSAAASQGALVLVSGDSRVAVDAGAVVSAGVDGGDFLFRVVEGNAAYTANGETQTAAAGEAFALGGGTGPRAIRGAAVLSPRPSARFLYPGEGKLAVPFRWNRINLDPEDLIRLEIAEDRGFTRVVFREDLAGDTALAELEGGSWFWRLSAAGADGASAPNAYSLKIVSAPAPALIAPAEGQRYQFRVKKPVVRFQWRGIPEASSYVLEAANSPAMANPALVKEVRGTSLYSSELGPGTWYWRVRPVFSADYEGTAGEGIAASFVIVQSGALGSPVLQHPLDRGIVNIAAGQRDLHFSWRNEPEARSYTIRISANQDLSDPLIDETVRDNIYVYRIGENIIKTGQYYWGVLQTDEEGTPSALSPARSFSAIEGEIIQRTVFPPDGYTVAAAMMPDIRFTWKTNVPVQTRFQISDRTDFSRLTLDETVGGEIFQGRILPEGVWYWRIQARGSGGAVFETAPKSFTVAPPLPAPGLLEPGPDGRVLLQEGEAVRFSWGASPGAEYYQFKLYHMESGNRPIYENNLVEGTSQSLFMADYPEGRYSWAVQGFASESSRSTRRTGLLAGGDFIARRLHPVSLDYPNHGETVEGLRAYLEPGTVRWSSLDAVSTSRFILSRSQDLSGPSEAVINDPPPTIALPRLREGNYYWTVRAETADGFDISARAPRLLRVLPILPLPEAANRVPRNGTVITGADLRRNRNIVFSWDAVPGATSYLFALEHEGTGKAIVPERLFTGTSFVLEDLTLLDVGTFFWRVEAVLTEQVRERREDTGEIIQRGEVGENRFGIEFIPPDMPDLRRPGILYGRE
jgi:hypothetical protein